MEPVSSLKPPTRMMNWNFVLLWQGQVISQFGTQISRIAMLFWLKHATESPSLMGAIAMFAGVIAVLLGPFGGALADRYPRRSIIIACDLINGSAMITLSILMFFAPTAQSWILVGIFIVSVLLSAVGSFFSPAISASTADLVPKEKVAAATSTLQASDQISIRLGQAAGGTLFQILGAPFVLLIDGVTYLISAFSECFVTIPQKLPEKNSDWRGRIREFMHDIWEGLNYVRANAGLAQLFLIVTLLNFFLAQILGLYPFYIEDHLKLGPDWYGYLLATLGCGVLVGYLLAGTIKVSGRSRSRLMVACMLLTAAMCGLLGVIESPMAVAAVTVVIGVVSGFLNVGVMTILQITTPSEIRGRAFGLLGALSGCLLPIGMGMAGLAASLNGKNIPQIYLFCGGCMTLVVIVASNLSQLRAYLAFEPDDRRAEISLDQESEKMVSAD
ncbi:MAG TPA: MFS transporter [Blastocatellia bacterium]|nr:MFS transporter [Blastocatellia bacterium]